MRPREHFPLKDLEATPHCEGVRASSAVVAGPLGQPDVPSHVRATESEGRLPLEPRSTPASASAFDDLYRQFFHDVCRWSRALGGLNADVEDIAQEVFLVVRRKLDSFDGQHPRAWLYGITRRAVSDYRRRAWFRRVLQPFEALLDAPSDAPSPNEIARKNEASRALNEMLNRLSPVRRAAFILFEIEGYTGEEIAELEGIPLNTVYTRLHHARKDFMEQVAKHRQSQGDGE